MIFIISKILLARQSPYSLSWNSLCKLKGLMWRKMYILSMFFLVPSGLRHHTLRVQVRETTGHSELRNLERTAVVISIMRNNLQLKVRTLLCRSASTFHSYWARSMVGCKCQERGKLPMENQTSERRSRVGQYVDLIIKGNNNIYCAR